MEFLTIRLDPDDILPASLALLTVKADGLNKGVSCPVHAVSSSLINSLP